MAVRTKKERTSLSSILSSCFLLSLSLPLSTAGSREPFDLRAQLTESALGPVLFMAEQQVVVSGISGPLAVFRLPSPALTRDLQRQIKRELGVRVRDQQLLVGLIELPPSAVLPSEDDCGPITLLRVKRRCYGCDKNRPLRKCAACLSVYYCGQTCQRIDWKRHKREDACRERQKALAICAAARAKATAAEQLAEVKAA